MRARKVRRDAAAGADLAPEADLDGERTALSAVALVETERAIARLPEEQRAALALVAALPAGLSSAAGA